jgi:hypothetical protein
MSLLWLVSRHVDRQKRELLQYLSDSGACDAQHAIDLASVDVKPSILRAMIARNIVKRTPSGKYFLDQSRVHEAYGASNSFILYAMGAFILLFLVIMFW